MRIDAEAAVYIFHLMRGSFVGNLVERFASTRIAAHQEEMVPVGAMASSVPFLRPC